MKVDLTFLESVSSATLAAWLEASNRETVRLQRELAATRAAKSALLAEITRRNRVAVSLPAKPNVVDPTPTCKNCVRLGGGWRGVFVCEKDDSLKSPNAPSCASFDPYPPQFFGAEISETDPRR